MYKLIAVAIIVGLALAAWGVASVMSSDAIGMIIGLLFGILVPLPGIFLILVAARRNAERDPFRQPPPPVVYEPSRPAALLPPPTIIVVQLPDGRHVRAQVIEGQRRLDD